MTGHDLQDIVDFLWRRIRLLHICYGGFEISQTESAFISLTGLQVALLLSLAYYYVNCVSEPSLMYSHR